MYVFVLESLQGQGYHTDIIENLRGIQNQAAHHFLSLQELPALQHDNTRTLVKAVAALKGDVKSPKQT